MNHITPDGMRRLRETKLAARNPNWKGDSVQYRQLHAWVKARLIKPELCSRCRQRPAFDLTNKGTYNRDLRNWEWLCRHCHMESDGRLAVFVSHTNAGKRGRANGNYRHGKQCQDMLFGKEER